MKRHLIALGVAVIALAVGVGTATAANDPPPGADQLLGQLAGATQGAPAAGTAGQTASNASLPVGISGLSGVAVGSGSGSATQTAGNSADGNATNTSSTDQTANATQTGGSSSCTSGCGGAGQAQAIDQSALTKQDADAEAAAHDVMTRPSYRIDLILGEGPGRARYLTSDLGIGYVRCNADYRS